MEQKKRKKEEKLAGTEMVPRKTIYPPTLKRFPFDGLGPFS